MESQHEGFNLNEEPGGTSKQIEVRTPLTLWNMTHASDLVQKMSFRFE